MFKAIIFDLDDTLMPDEPAADAALLAVAGAVKQWHNIPPADFQAAVRRIAREVWRANPVVASGIEDISSWEALSSTFVGGDEEMQALHDWAPEYRYTVWSRALAENGIVDPLLTEQLSALYPLERRSRYQPFPDALPTLNDLRTDHRLGLITNGPCDLQCEKLERAGLAGFFEVRVISREVGVMKPDPRIFRIALEHMALGPADAVFVGDTPKHDVAGAHNAGMKAVWLNRDNRPAPDGVAPDAAITGLAELRPALARL